MVNLENREFLMDLTDMDMRLFRLQSGLPHVVEEHISVDVFLNKQMVDRYMFLEGPKNIKLFASLTPKTRRRLKYKLYTDKPEGINWDKEKENVEV